MFAVIEAMLTPVGASGSVRVNAIQGQRRVRCGIALYFRGVKVLGRRCEVGRVMGEV